MNQKIEEANEREEVLFKDVVEGLKEGTLKIQYDSFIFFGGRCADQFDYNIQNVKDGTIGRISLRTDDTVRVEYNGESFDNCFWEEDFNIDHETITDYDHMISEAVNLALKRDDPEIFDAMFNDKYGNIVCDNEDIPREEVLKRKWEIDSISREEVLEKKKEIDSKSKVNERD